MQIHVVNTINGFVCANDNDYEAKRKLKIGQIYKVEVKQARNYELHKKYFALINCAWEYLTEAATDHFVTPEQFRKTVEISAGHCDRVYSLERNEWVEVPKSISFEKMGEFEFRELYENAKRVIFAVFLKHVTFEQFDEALRDF